MRYIEKQRERAIALRDMMFQDSGQGMFSGKPRDFVLKDPAKNFKGAVISLTAKILLI